MVFKSGKKDFFNYIAVYFLTGFSGTFFFPNKDIFFIITFLFFSFVFFKRRLNFDREFLIFFVYSLLIVFGQTLTFETFSIIGITRGIMTFVFGYIIIKIVGINFTKYLINILFFFTIVSFVFYTPSLISPSFHASIASIADKLGTDAYGYNEWGYQGNNFIIYTWRDWTYDGLLRNTGNYTEAGAFGSVLVLVLILNVIETRKLISTKNFFFIAGILSTYSTSCYIALFIFLFFWFSESLNWKKKMILYPLIISSSFYLFISLPFLKDKIENQYITQVSDERSSGRFSTALADLKEIAKYPIAGRGFSKETRSDDPDWAGGSNGITGLAVTIAPLGFILYLLLMINSFQKYCLYYLFPPKFSYKIVGILLILAFAQYILSTPLFYSFVFLSSIINKNKINETFYLDNNSEL